jgi:hypothetical protein
MKNDIYIVAGGTSLKEFNFSKLKGKDIIAVNKSILDVPFAKYFITMDYTFIDKKLKVGDKVKFEQSKATKIFIANLCPKYMSEKDGRIIDKRTNYIYKLNAFDMIIKSQYNIGIGWNFNQFVHGNNSGFCALQLAICLGYTNIHLLGYDLCISENDTHYHKGYKQDPQKFNEKLKKYLSNFIYTLKILKMRRPNIKIYNYSSKGLLTFTTMKSLEDINE